MIPQIYPVSCHTDNVGAGTTFVAIPGMKLDGAQYIPLALEKGASKIIVETLPSQEILDLVERFGAQLEVVENARKALAELAAQALGYPARKMTILGVTGTKGKTTTSFLLFSILRSAGIKAALVSSAGNYILDDYYKTSHATPQPDYLHLFLNAAYKSGVTCVVLEIAAQALSCYRIEGIVLDGAIFTNFSREHGEFYASQEEYFKAKLSIIDHLKPQAPLLLNADDAHVSKIEARGQQISFFGINAGTYRVGQIYGSLKEGLRAHLFVNHDFFSEFSCPTLLGAYNGYNCVAAFGLAHQLGLSKEAILKGFLEFKGVPGRFNPQDAIYLANGAVAFIDKAHNPASFEAVLSTLGQYTDDLIVVFGAGGDRDPVRRPVMGYLADIYADRIMLTSDDPRSEDPVKIMNDINEGIINKEKVVLEVDRERALEIACKTSSRGSILAVLGKGPDEYQQIGVIKHYFSERMILQRFTLLRQQ